jgi:uncharacterized repeat protein (TIGR03803 family)
MSNTALAYQLVRVAIASVIALSASAVNAQPAATYEVVSSFSAPFPKGKNPTALTQGSDGTFYGTALLGGIFDTGTLFRMEPTGDVTPEHHFSGVDGAQPIALVRSSRGLLYGLTSQGGEFGSGTVFSYIPGVGVTTLHAFSQADRAPVDLFAASDGNVYGLTTAGGDFGNGIIFMITPAGTVTSVVSIPLGAGRNVTSIVKGSDGRFYGTANDGGAAGLGTLFTVDQTGAATILHNFAGQAAGDGARPAGLMQNHDGRLYGSTRAGGQSDAGIVYSISRSGDYTILHSFDASVDGARGSADLLEASDGNLYGATLEDTRLFRIDATETFTTLARPSADLAGDLIQGADGNLYVPTQTGGVFDGGLIYGRSLQGANTLLVDLTAGPRGDGRPQAIIQASDGQFYGTTGAQLMTRGTSGTVFAMDASGARTLLHAFRVLDGGSTGIFDGVPASGMFEGSDGSLYGTTFNDKLFGTSSYRSGQIFRVTPGSGLSTVATSYHLRAGVIQARDGMLYGVSGAGSDPAIPNLTDPTTVPNLGFVFRVDTNGVRTVVHEFTGGTDGANPVAELVETEDDNLYGTTEGGDTHGTIFRVNPATGTLTTVYRFTGPDGSKPVGRLVQGSDGLIYGTTSRGGAFGLGTVFVVDAAGTLTTLHDFAGYDGEHPNAGVILGLDGRLYGTTTNGGAFGYGTVFAISVSGELATLHDFTLSDGARPLAELIQANDGTLYGAAPVGGPNGGGVIFRVGLVTSPADEYFEIVSRSSSLCLDVTGASITPAAPVIQWSCHGGANQQFRLEPAGGGAFRIMARHSGQALDVSGGTVDDLAAIIQYTGHGGANQLWTLEPSVDGYVRIIARHSGKAMDVEGASTIDGTSVIQFSSHGGANQQWLLRRAGSTGGEP